MKYLLAYILPLCCYVGLTLGGVWSFLTPALAFGLIPFLELFLHGTDRSPHPISGRLSFLYDVLVVLHLPIMYILLYMLLAGIKFNFYAGYEIIGVVLSTGIILGSFGMNLGHEMGHRSGFGTNW